MSEPGWISACCGAYCGQDEDWCWNCNRDRATQPSKDKRCPCGHLVRFHDKQWPERCTICIRRYGRSDDVCDGKARDMDVTPDATTFTETCSQCDTEYLGVTDGVERIALCPHYFEHNPAGAYYPPNYRPDLLAELNGYRLEDGGVAVRSEPPAPTAPGG